MASIFNPEYRDGHKVLIKDRTMLRKVGSNVVNIVKNRSYNIFPGKTVFELIKTKSKQKNQKYTVDVSSKKTGNLEMYMMKSGTSQKYLFIGSKSSLQNMFTHAGDGKSSKSDTDDKTATKELASLCVFEEKLKTGKDTTYDYVYKKLPVKLKKFFTEEFFASSQKQLKLWLSKEKVVLKDKGLCLKDNLNPGDIWIVKKDLDFKVYEKSTNVKQINRQLVKDYNDGKCVGISLKHLTKNQGGKIDYINLSTTKKKEAKYDFTFEECDFSAETFKNAIIYSKSGFGPRMGFKASTSGFGVYLEGRFKGAGSQVGAIDATKIPDEINKRYKYTIRKGGTPDLKTEEPIALKEMKEMIKRHGAKKISNGLDSYKHFLELYYKAPEFQKQRFCRISSFMYPYLELSFAKGGDKEFRDLLSWSYSLAKKETDVGGLYVYIGP